MPFTTIYIMPSGKFPSQGGQPVAVTQEDFNNCCNKKTCYCITQYYAAWCWSYFNGEETVPGHWTTDSPWYDPDRSMDGCWSEDGVDTDWQENGEIEHEECGGPGVAKLYVYVRAGTTCKSTNADYCDDYADVEPWNWNLSQCKNVLHSAPGSLPPDPE